MVRSDVVHGNLKSDSILVIPTSPPVVKLFNFRMTKDCPSSYTAPEIFDKQIWSIEAIVYFLINGKAPTENLEKKANEYLMRSDMSLRCVDFVWKSLQYDTERRIDSGRLIVHPFLQEEVVEAERASGKLMLIQSLLEEGKRRHLRETKAKRIKFAIDEAYVCHCEDGKEVMLTCGHLFCIGCIAKIREKSIFTDSFVKVPYNNSDPDIQYNAIEIQCPK